MQVTTSNYFFIHILGVSPKASRRRLETPIEDKDDKPEEDTQDTDLKKILLNEGVIGFKLHVCIFLFVIIFFHIRVKIIPFVWYDEFCF